MSETSTEERAMGGSAPREALKRLDVLVGEWVVESGFPDLAAPAGRTVFEWTLDGRFLVQRSEIPVPEAPDSTAIVATDPETGAYTQHYFDSRGIVRLYAMTFAGGVWRLLRETPDFSPLAFRQRFTGQVADDGDTIHGVWETSPTDGPPAWEQDFTVTYRRSR
ncbi:hypothetical protein [Streptomyces sp. NPDC050287]|uniref:hypothetical protein n=1 Tax=Streptomyces sp. NPDC050287 TaxID=3365608 RepID=UPI003789A8A2